MKMPTSRILAYTLLISFLSICPVATRQAFGQERRERETRDERRERERKADENGKLDRDGDRVGRDTDKLGREDRKLNRSSESLDRKSDTLSREGDRTARETGREGKNERGFSSEQSFDSHYQDHKAEFGKDARGQYITGEEYLRKAQGLRDTPADGKNVKEIQRGDDRISKYDTRSNDFGVYERDGTVVTFFRPSGGEQYFERQAEARK